MSDKETGGPAFPNPGHDNGPGNFRSRPSDGMTLRDYFAAKAMAALIQSVSNTAGFGEGEFDKLVAKCAYDYATAMLKAREE